MSTICVKLFAIAREVAGRDEWSLDLPEGATVAEVRRALVEELPGLAPLLRHAMFAVNQEYAGDSTIVTIHDEVALIPPVSGG